MSALLSLQFTDLFLGSKFYMKNHGEIENLPDKYHAEAKEIYEDLKSKTSRDFRHDYQGENFRVAKIESLDGTWFVLRRGYPQVPSFEDLRCPKPLQAVMLDPEQLPFGLLVFSGSTGSGKTTSASAFIRARLDSVGGHAVTIEDPPELPLTGEYERGVCFQRELHYTEFGEGIMDAMRQGSPDIIMLGELREPVATSEALRAAINGHLIVTTIHTPGIIEAIERMRALSQAREGDAKGVLNLLAGGISGIIHQSLGPEGLKMQSLFISPNDKGIRNKIREGNIQQLSTDIQQQQNQLYLQAHKNLKV